MAKELMEGLYGGLKAVAGGNPLKDRIDSLETDILAYFNPDLPQPAATATWAMCSLVSARTAPRRPPSHICGRPGAVCVSSMRLQPVWHRRGLPAAMLTSVLE